MFQEGGENQQRVQQQIQQAAEGDADGGVVGPALGADQIGQQGVHHRKGAAQDNDPLRVPRRPGEGFGRRAAQI